MPNNQEQLNEYAKELFQEIRNEADAKGRWHKEIFFDRFTDAFIDIGDMDEAVHSEFTAPNGITLIDGYCGDPIEYAPGSDPDAPLTLGLIILDFNASDSIETMTKREMNTYLNRPIAYLKKYALKPGYRDSLEPSSPQFELADMIASRWERIDKIKLYILTNKALSKRIDGETAPIEFQGRKLSYSVWDISRLQNLEQAKNGREELQIDFTTQPLTPLRALLASTEDAPNPVYLAAIPGIELAQIYDRWGTRLLEQNVRVFLQARTNVNKGIKRTIEQEPEQFFSFNNGITATAEAVEVEENSNSMHITGLTNLQIVNGGQTTASIYAAYKAGKDLSRVFVQMKLSIIAPEQAEKLVPRISEYANSQNRVTQADLFANHPYHTRIEYFSRERLAPMIEGSFDQTKWFYERARGQYANQMLYFTSAEKTRFKKMNPTKQKFSKTDLAKYLMAWSDKPYFVPRGAQKNFAAFAKIIADQWETDDTIFNEYYFHTLIAKKIIWDTAEYLIPKRPWYEAGGYRAPLVAYSIALIAETARRRGASVNFDRIWREQTIDPTLVEAINKAADAVSTVVLNPGTGYSNISEWAKQEKCWNAIKKLDAAWSPDFLNSLVPLNEVQNLNRESMKEQREANAINNELSVINMGADFWKQVGIWLLKEHEGSDAERGCVTAAASMPSKIPTERQCKVIVRMMRRLAREGCPYQMDYVF